MNKILLLEDDLSLVNGLTFAFHKQGFALDVARTVLEASTLWADGKYDLILSILLYTFFSRMFDLLCFF